MTPDYKKAAAKAAQTSASFGSCVSPDDVLRILKSFPSVFVAALDVNPLSEKEVWGAFTLVREKNGVLQYIVTYNKRLPSFLLLRVLARELGHVVLRHDGTAPEEIWMEEADCFSYHLVCSAVRTVTVYFRPERKSASSSFKDMIVFDSMDALKRAVADEQTRYCRFIGKKDVFHPADVEIRALDEKDALAGWKNYSSVIVAGRPVGYCGE